MRQKRRGAVCGLGRNPIDRGIEGQGQRVEPGLIPAQPRAKPPADLQPPFQQPEIGPVVMDIAISAGEKLKAMTDCEKINIAAIGNMVRQLHIHVIARNEGDQNWPGPVWGYGSAEPYEEPEAAELVAKLKEQLFDPSLS